MEPSPYIINLKPVHTKGGSLCVLEEQIPFEIKRIYWVYNSDKNIPRGGHAHINSNRVIVCMNGIVDITLENVNGDIFHYKLEQPNKALFFPKMHWITIQCSQDAVFMTAVSSIFDDDEYIRDKAVFHKQ